MSAITTFSGEKFNPLNPDVEKIKIGDIAHALSMLCRANGHFKSFYSVAQHSINCANEAKARGYSLRVQLACLLHDASEAYLSDITRPVKEKFTQYHEFEKKLQNVIMQKWFNIAVSEDEYAQVKLVDDALLHDEFEKFMNEEIFSQEPYLKSQPQYDFEDFLIVEKKFLEMFEFLKAAVNNE